MALPFSQREEEGREREEGERGKERERERREGEGERGGVLCERHKQEEVNCGTTKMCMELFPCVCVCVCAVTHTPVVWPGS